MCARTSPATIRGLPAGRRRLHGGHHRRTQGAPLPESYQSSLGEIPFIRQVLISPPLIIDPPMNTRTGQFQRVADNPLAG